MTTECYLTTIMIEKGDFIPSRERGGTALFKWLSLHTFTFPILKLIRFMLPNFGGENQWKWIQQIHKWWLEQPFL